MIERVLIVGCGNIGLRHLEATVDAGVAEIWIVEKDLALLGRRLEGTSLRDRASLRLCSSLDPAQLPATGFDCVISALTTTAQVGLFADILAVRADRYLLEKPIAQSITSLVELQRRIVEGPGMDSVHVNCSRNAWRGYLRIRDSIRELRNAATCNFHMAVSGNVWGIGCNGVHYLELFRFLTGARSIEVAWQQLAQSPSGNRRGPEFEEFVGSATFRNDAGDTLEITSTIRDMTGKGLSIRFEEANLGPLFLVDEVRDLCLDLRELNEASLGTTKVSLSTCQFLRSLHGADGAAPGAGLPLFGDVQISQAALLNALREATGRDRIAIT